MCDSGPEIENPPDEELEENITIETQTLKKSFLQPGFDTQSLKLLQAKTIVVLPGDMDIKIRVRKPENNEIKIKSRTAIYEWEQRAVTLEILPPVINRREVCDTKHEVYFPIPRRDFPKEQDWIYKAIQQEYPQLDIEDIVLVQFYPLIPIGRILSTRFVDKKLHAHFKTAVPTKNWASRVYFLEKESRKTRSIDILHGSSSKPFTN